MAAGPRRRRSVVAADLTVRWIVDGNNVFGSRPDGWWNDRDAAARRLAQSVAEWCCTHDDDVTLVFDAPVAPATFELAGGNLTIVESRRRGRNAADDRIVEVVEDVYGREPDLWVVTSDRGLADRLPPGVTIEGAGRFRTRLGLRRPDRTDRSGGPGRRGGPRHGPDRWAARASGLPPCRATCGRAARRRPSPEPPPPPPRRRPPPPLGRAPGPGVHGLSPLPPPPPRGGTRANPPARRAPPGCYCVERKSFFWRAPRPPPCAACEWWLGPCEKY